MRRILSFGIAVGIALGIAQAASAASGPLNGSAAKQVQELHRVEQREAVWPAPQESGAGGFPGCVRSQVSGPAQCNCTSRPATFQICEEESIEVTLGSEGIGSISTGKKNTTCTSQEVPPGACDFMVYNVVCCKVTHWFFFTSWECWVESSSLASRPAKKSECPPAQE